MTGHSVTLQKGGGLSHEYFQQTQNRQQVMNKPVSRSLRLVALGLVVALGSTAALES